MMLVQTHEAGSFALVLGQVASCNETLGLHRYHACGSKGMQCKAWPAHGYVQRCTWH